MQISTQKHKIYEKVSQYDSFKISKLDNLIQRYQNDLNARQGI
jgi:hypothetical protein